MPGPRPLLSAMVLVRLVLVALAVGRALGQRTTARDAAIPSFLLLGAVALSASLWLIWRLRRREIPGPSALLLQAAVDILVITSLVSFTQEGATAIAALYVAVVTLYAMVLPVGRGLLVVAFAVACYVAVTMHTNDSPDPSFWAQVGVIAFVGALIAVLGNRLSGASQERHALEAALVQARLEAEEILASIQSGVITVDGEGRLAFINPRGMRILGGDAQSFAVGEPILEALRARSRELHDAIERGLQDGARVSRGEAAVRRRDGSLFPVGLSTTTFERPGSDRRLVTAIFTDISDLKRLQEFRLRAERLEAVAALSASLAHEIRNPLAAIRSAVEQLTRSAEDNEDDQVLARLVIRESERLNRLLSEFLDFSRVRASKFTRVDLLELVQNAAKLVAQHPALEGISLTVEGDPIELDVDEDLMHRVVNNLVLNAAQALGGSGNVTVAARRAERGEGPAGYLDRLIKLTVTDDGPGIPEAVRDRLFEPFVTGRPGGSGLGLAIVQRAVAAHRGVVMVDTTPGAGTTFSIYLPSTWDRGGEA